MAPELDPRIVDELKATYTSMEEAGELLTRDQLTNYYALSVRALGQRS